MWAITARLAPILAFLAAITCVAELASAAQLFDVLAAKAARFARGSTPALFALIVVLGTLSTELLSLDTTAVLLTPVVLALAQQLEVSPLPFAMLSIWLANTMSLLLPVSNLTNLLAVDKLHLSPTGFAQRMILPQLAALVVTVATIGMRYRRQITTSYEIPPPVVLRDPPLTWLAGAVCLALIPLFLLGVPVQWPAIGAAAILASAFAFKQRESLHWRLIPWRLVLGVEALFLVVTAAGPGRYGLNALLGHAAGHSGSAAGVLRTAVVGALGSNGFNNLPSYIALEPVADHHRQQLLGLLLGTNLGPMILIWGSLATLLWRTSCRNRGVEISAWEFAKVGLVGVPLLIATSWAALVF